MRLHILFRNLLPIVFVVPIMTDAGFADEAAWTRLTTDGRLKRDPVVIDGGQSIVYTVLETEDRLRLMRLDLSDGTSSPLHEDVTKSEFEAVFSPDGSHCAFVQSRGNLSLALVIRNTQTGSDTEVPPAGGFSGLRSPVFSADGRRVLYCFPEDGRQQIFSVNLAAQDRKKVIDSSGVNNWPGELPDGKGIVFGSTRDGNYEIYRSELDGSNAAPLTTHRAQDIRPRVAPDGSRVAFTSNRDGNYEIYTVGIDGTGLQRVTANAERDDYAAWFPDSRRIVLVAERRGRFDLYLPNTPE